MGEEAYPESNEPSLPAEVSRRLASKTVRIIALCLAIAGSIWTWWQTIRIAFGVSFLASLAPALIPTMAFVLTFTAIGIVSAVFLLIAGYRRGWAIGFTVSYFVVSLATWLAALYVPGLVPTA